MGTFRGSPLATMSVRQVSRALLLGSASLRAAFESRTVQGRKNEQGLVVDLIVESAREGTDKLMFLGIVADPAVLHREGRVDRHPM